MFIEGDLHGGPALFVRGDGSRFLYSYMYHGRPSGEGIWFRPDGFKAHVSSIKLKQDVSGEASYVGDFDDGKFHGQGKFFFTKGSTFLGEWYKDLMKEGLMIRLNYDSTVSMFREVYDAEKDFKDKKLAVS